ncbi:hypothetical protein N510_003589 [Firmicutes bacterium ASF500]|nr:hypothetical protein N510_003589 [Firmicutes bacterium ASF500]
MVFTPVFFAGVGMKTNLRDMNSSILVFALLLVLAAVLSKVVGCGLGGLACRMTRHQSLVVGIGMVARSEVALMVAQRGISAGMIDPAILPAIVLAVIASALLTPCSSRCPSPRAPSWYDKQRLSPLFRGSGAVFTGRSPPTPAPSRPEAPAGPRGRRWRRCTGRAPGGAGTPAPDGRPGGPGRCRCVA